MAQWTYEPYDEEEEKKKAKKGDIVYMEDDPDKTPYKVTGRYIEMGLEDIGIHYLDKDGNEMTTYDGCYIIVSKSTEGSSNILTDPLT